MTERIKQEKFLFELRHFKSLLTQNFRSTSSHFQFTSVQFPIFCHFLSTSGYFLSTFGYCWLNSGHFWSISSPFWLISSHFQYMLVNGGYFWTFSVTSNYIPILSVTSVFFLYISGHLPVGQPLVTLDQLSGSFQWTFGYFSVTSGQFLVSFRSIEVNF